MTKDASPQLCLIGAGNMGGALLSGWLEKGVLGGKMPVVLDPHAGPHLQSLAAEGRISLNPDTGGLDPDVVLVAVKPQVFLEVLAPLEFLKDTKALVVSVVAGKEIAAFKDQLGAGAAVVRAMPNTPAAIGLGMSVAKASDEVSAAQRDLATRLLEAVGRVAWVEKEDDLNAVTAVSGSGPAYVFLMIEALAAAGVAQGLNEELAMTLAVETVRGAGALAAVSEDDAATLRQKVTSPGGTTAAALEVLMGDPGLKELMGEAVAAATERARELG
ncbi:MAG: pyrroline-5-carboxylate reductase [Alphaproteobacteria bacterium]|nr:MAG: pyrroline-5-carboxylate reductase [Alphaproteobacteria bacterium]